MTTFCHLSSQLLGFHELFQGKIESGSTAFLYLCRKYCLFVAYLFFCVWFLSLCPKLIDEWHCLLKLNNFHTNSVTQTKSLFINKQASLCIYYRSCGVGRAFSLVRGFLLLLLIIILMARITMRVFHLPPPPHLIVWINQGTRQKCSSEFRKFLFCPICSILNFFIYFVSACFVLYDFYLHNYNYIFILLPTVLPLFVYAFQKCCQPTFIPGTLPLLFA